MEMARFESLVQLGVGLNFAFTALNFLLDGPFNALKKRYQSLLSDIKSAASDNTQPSTIAQKYNISLLEYNKFRPRITLISDIYDCLRKINAFLSITFGFFCIFLLITIAYFPEAIVSECNAVFFIVFPSVGWFLLYVASLISLSAATRFITPRNWNANG